MYILDKHPAPWTYDSGGNSDAGHINDANGALVVCELYMGHQGPEDADGVPTESTADEVRRLLLTAPELLALAQKVSDDDWHRFGMLGSPADYKTPAIVRDARALIQRVETGSKDLERPPEEDKA